MAANEKPKPPTRSIIDGLFDWPRPRVAWQFTEFDKIFLLHIGVMSAKQCIES